LGEDAVNRVLHAMDHCDEYDETRLTSRERAFLCLIRANSATEDERSRAVQGVAAVLTVDEIYHANTVIALFNFYNSFVDLNGVDPLTHDGYQASGVRLSTHGYAPPAAAAPSSS
jgi:hypothetical protein